eukprot:Awhi_evm1s11222
MPVSAQATPTKKVKKETPSKNANKSKRTVEDESPSITRPSTKTQPLLRSKSIVKRQGNNSNLSGGQRLEHRTGMVLR